MQRPSDPVVVDRLRAICTALPEVTERLSHGEPTWFVRDKKTFVTTSDHHHDDRFGFWCAAPPG
ncbi:MAG TPA: MmcQ/YjbR family DNA-binding protein, partial [Ilumatobacteraceae bacterium]|nr:MmcQ/YjbR family DNA-binding protein [Ilumatobacteraceae bacterium]